MATDIFLGEPPARIKQWILEHLAPPGPVPHDDTRFTLEDGAVESKNITGTLSLQTMSTYGYYDNENGWIKSIIQLDIGSDVTKISDSALFTCKTLSSLLIPDSVKNIGYGAFEECENLATVTVGNGIANVSSLDERVFSGCAKLTSITFNGLTRDQVQTLTTENMIFGDSFYDPYTYEPIAKSFTAVCMGDLMTINFSAEDPATITFTYL